MLFFNLNVHWENASLKIKNNKLHWPYYNKIIKEAHSTPIRFLLHISISKKTKLNTTYRNISVDDTKILHTNNNIKNLKLLEALYIKFRQLTINRINFETSDNILKCLK